MRRINSHPQPEEFESWLLTDLSAVHFLIFGPNFFVFKNVSDCPAVSPLTFLDSKNKTKEKCLVSNDRATSNSASSSLREGRFREGP